MLLFFEFRKIFTKKSHIMFLVLLNILIFGLLYLLLDVFIGDMFYYTFINDKTYFQKFINKLYYSATTFTTLGLGDIYPIHPFSQILTIIQTMTALFIVLSFTF